MSDRGVLCQVWFGGVEPQHARFSRVPFVGELIHVFDLPPLVVRSVAHEQIGSMHRGDEPIAAILACEFSNGTPDDTRPWHSICEGIVELLRRVPYRSNDR